MNPLLQPLDLGDLRLRNRVVMAPMTRNRAQPDGVPGEAMARYYGQRAGAGLIVSEGTWPCAEGQAYCRQPGIATPQQLEGWRRVARAVHEAGGLIVMQLMHGGRIGSRHIKPVGVATLAPSAVAAAGQVWTDAAGMQPHDTPVEMSDAQVRQAIAAHGEAAARAMDAGFDGVELHGTSGYLPMQFLSSSTNRRHDEWGGPAAARAGFVTACLRAMGQAAGLGRVGLRLNPGNTYNDTADEDSGATHAEAVRQAAQLGIGWLHMMRAPVPHIDAFALARAHFRGPVIVNDGFSPESGAEAVQRGTGDAGAFGRHFIGNPDLVARIRQGWPLASFDRKTLYTPGEAGYCDYPAYAPG